MDIKYLLMINTLKEVALFTGSKRWGVDTEASDEDYVISPILTKKYYQELTELVKDNILKSGKCNYKEGNNFRFVYAEFNINLILTESDVVFNSWRYATEQMDKQDKDAIRDKANRVRIFKKFFDEYRNGELNKKETKFGTTWQSFIQETYYSHEL